MKKISAAEIVYLFFVFPPIGLFNSSKVIILMVITILLTLIIFVSAIIVFVVSGILDIIAIM